MTGVEEPLQLGKGNLDLYFGASKILLPNVPTFWKGSCFSALKEVKGKCVRAAGRSLAIA